MEVPLLELKRVSKIFPYGLKKGNMILNDINFIVKKSQTLAILGQSGCGKTTLCRCLAGIEQPNSGQIFFEGKQIYNKRTPDERRNIQIVFQNPVASLNPNLTIKKILEEPLVIHKISKSVWHSEIMNTINAVGLDESFLSMFPIQLSGGQCQRINIARAILLKPKLLICDEPISSLDILSQMMILNLLKDLKTQCDMTYIFVSHDEEIVKKIADKIVRLHA
ncbi:MAG: dipeptide/oligopeptide/nickel ABC transporter ATP-binding protein [Deltaproteobacteria bacterium]|jgi:ABC-type dipeptide/oligopeptide/nickel transport system ATPase subunit|nr:dipeptide/oligopeptide/nickel ABC transporter ATP-binding protein [Deltaproteobacteria bacterium]